MGRLLDADNWVEVPSGEARLGLSEAQRREVVDHLLGMANPEAADRSQRGLLQAAGEKLRKSPRDRLNPAERKAFQERFSDRQKFLYVEETLTTARPEIVKVVDRFYISKFPLTETQYYEYTHGKGPLDLPGTYDEPETQTIEVKGNPREVFGRWAAEVRTEVVLRFLQELSGRLPTEDEWEKAARGTDGRLYPWGNEWDEARGFFYSGQDIPSDHSGRGRSVTAFQTGVSPYGAWGMVGGLPELVTVGTVRPVMTSRASWQGREILVDVKGAHPRESSREFAWFDHIVALPGQGHWVGLRPVLDEWPLRSWSGHQFEAHSATESP